MRTTKSIVIVLVLSFNRRFVSTHTTAAAAFAAVPSSTSSTMLRSVTTITSTSQNSSSSSIADARDQRLVYGANDALFGYIEDQQGHKPFGKVLDAGTGVHSLRWIATLGDLGRTTRNNRTTTSRHKGLTDFVAVTADETMRHTVQHELDALGLNHLGKIVIGNWFPAAASNNNNNNNKNKNKNSNDAGTTDEAALRSIDYDETGQRQLYDTIIADYLIGAMDGFSPYKQDMMLDLLAQRLQPGGRLYIVGLEPIPDSYGGTTPNSPQAIICDVRRIRDACILLAGDRCYREYPVEWIERQLHAKQAPSPSPAPPAHTNTSSTNNHHSSSSSSNTPRLHWLASKQFPILYSHRTIVKQIEVARKKLPQIPSKALARELSNTLRELELRSYAATEQISNTTRIQCGFDYVVSAERSMPDVNNSNSNSNSNNKGGGDDSSLDHIHTNEEL